ncbi:hypothetical protein EDB85DRAFT_2150627 [Lactarius pseudohatsudake]|nr:hypothetical protein EDB85DRAFT_2150627 [Lactarius pseudohatsudake]
MTKARPSYRKCLGSSPAATFAHLDATTVLSCSIADLAIYPADDPLGLSNQECPVLASLLSRSIAELAIYPVVDPLDSKSRMLDPRIVSVLDPTPVATFTHLDATSAVAFDC